MPLKSRYSPTGIAYFGSIRMDPLTVSVHTQSSEIMDYVAALRDHADIFRARKVI